MTRFDDELRAVLRTQAERVRLPADPMTGVARHVRRIRRRRISVGAGLGIAVIGVLVPLTSGHARPGTSPGEGPELAVSTRPQATRTPDNLLRWPRRGAPPPLAFARAVTTWYARDAAHDGARPDRVRQHVLWTGRLPDSSWATLDQVWNPTDRSRRTDWSTVLLVGPADGVRLRAAYDLPTRFVHQRPGENTAATLDDLARIAGYGFGFRDYVLVVGSPRAARAAVSTDGRTVTTEPLHDGAAVFPGVRPRGRSVLFQLTDAAGTLLTPADRRDTDAGGAVPTVAGWHLDLQP